jgi:hypothetical protein
MQPTRLTVKFTAGALGLALVAATLALPAPARAADDEVPIDTRILRGVLESLGLKKDEGSGIDYQERAPLVIPPNRDLPPPESAGAVAKNPAWPNDPDIARARAEAARARHRNVEAEILREQNPLRPDEMTPGAKYAKPAPRREAARGPAEDSPSITGHYGLSPKELGTRDLFSNMFGSKSDANVGRFTGEPARTALTQPPPGYQVPSPDQPYGLGKDTSKPKATDYLATHGEISSEKN